MQHICDAGEPLSNSDLVGWVQLGVQHVPRSEDIPIGEALKAPVQQS
jgi:Cu2+-containing amine oxidase